MEEDKGVYGYVTITVTGDPARTISKLVYRPFAKDGKTDGGPVMTFLSTHFNETKGIQRSVSTSTWTEVFGKTSLSADVLVRKGREMGLPSFTD